MPLCPKCQLYEFKAGDNFCSGCRNKLTSFTLSPNSIYIYNPKENTNPDPKLIEFSNLDDEYGNKVANDLIIEVSPDSSHLWSDHTISLSIEDKPLSLPCSLILSPNKTNCIKIEIDPNKFKDIDKEDISLFLRFKSNDPVSPEESVNIYIYSELPIPAFSEEDEPHNRVEKIEFDERVFTAKENSEILEKVIRLYNNGGGLLSLRKAPKKPDWIQLLEYPQRLLTKGSFGRIRIKIDPNKLPQDPQGKKAYQGELQFSFNEVDKDIIIKLNISIPPFANLIITGYGSDAVISESLIPVNKGRKISYHLQIDNKGSGNINVNLWQLEGAGSWASLRGLSFECYGPEAKDKRTGIILVVDTTRFQLKQTYELTILAHTNAINSPTSISLGFYCPDMDEPDTVNYMAIDFGTVTSSGAYYDNTMNDIIPMTFLTSNPDQDCNTVPSRLLFRSIDEPIIGWNICEEKSKILDIDKRYLFNLKRLIGSQATREILGKKYHPEELAELIFQFFINRIVDKLERIPTRIVATCPAAFYHYQRASILRACRRALLRNLLTTHGVWMINRINEVFIDDLPQSQIDDITELFQHPLFEIDREKYEYRDSSGAGSILIRLMIFVLEHRYSIWRGEEKVDDDFSRRIHNLTKNLLDYFEPQLCERVISKDLPKDWGHTIDKMENLLGIVLNNCDVIDIKILDEPTASAYAYIYLNSQKRSEQLLNLSDNEKEQYVSIIDCGGGTTDISWVRIYSPEVGSYELEVLAIGGTETGGEDIDRTIIERCLEERFRKGEDIDTRYKELLVANFLGLGNLIKDEKIYGYISESKLKIKQRAERQKIELSESSESVQDYRLWLEDGRQISGPWSLSRKDFNNMIQPEIKKIIDLVQRVLMDKHGVMKNGEKNLDKVILVGKSCRIPRVKEALIEAFGWPEGLIDPILNEQDKSCVSVGAVYYGRMMGRQIGIIGSHILPYNIGYIVPKKDRFVIIEGLNKGIRITKQLQGKIELEFTPFRREEILIAQSEKEDSRAFGNPSLKVIGKYTFVVRERERAQERILLNFFVNESGLIEVKGSYKDSSKFSGYYYPFETSREEKLPYIFI